MRRADRRGRVNTFYQTALLSVDSVGPTALTHHVNPSHFKVPHGTSKQTAKWELLAVSQGRPLLSVQLNNECITMDRKG